MLPYIIGGIAIAATGYGIKKFLNDENIDDVLFRGADLIDETDEKIERFFDNLKVEVDNLFDEEKKSAYEDLMEPANNIEESPLNLFAGKSLLIKPKNSFEEAKRKLCQSTLRELHAALSEIKNLDTLPSLSWLDDEDTFFSIDEDAKEQFDNYASILTEAKNYIDANLDKLDTIIISSDDFNSYGDDDKNFIKELVELFVTIEKVATMKFEGKDISREVKRAFAKIEKTIG